MLRNTEATHSGDIVLKITVSAKRPSYEPLDIFGGALLLQYPWFSTAYTADKTATKFTEKSNLCPTLFFWRKLCFCFVALLDNITTV